MPSVKLWPLIVAVLSPVYAERQESLTLKFSFPSHWLPKLPMSGQCLPDSEGRQKKEKFLSPRLVFYMQRFTFAHCKDNRTKGSDNSVLPKNKSKLCPGSMADKYQLEINTVLSSCHTG